ncbi:trichohyalin [Phymastichus coffea]|uniref:trichohyalin n=1 Tax=Phymastichus coffea TaxID=108790 RepID=UPI00273AA79C|nr:trichohyalin [Phymastichus coffea]XP_058803852.1 trichohyalin [Phymastichus coffea]
MRRTRHVVLPVKSWQSIGLLIVSLACLTLGHVSRDREGRHGSLVGPELLHTAPHEVDACPNNCSFILSSSGASATLSRSALATPTSSGSRDTRSTRESSAEGRRARVIGESRERRSARLRSRSMDEAAIRRVRLRSVVERRAIEDARRGRALVRNQRVRELRESSIKRSLVPVEGQVGAFDNRLDTRAERWASSAERRARGSHMVRQVRDVRAEGRATRIQRTVRVAERHLDTRAEHRIRTVDGRQYRDSVFDRRVRDSEIRRAREVRAERRVIDAERRLDVRGRWSTERQVRVADNRRARESNLERRVRDAQAVRRFASAERRVRAAENRRARGSDLEHRARYIDERRAERRVRDVRTEGRSLSEERRVRDNLQARDSDMQRRIRQIQAERRLGSGDNERRVRERRVAGSEHRENRLDSQVERRARSLDSRRVRISKVERRVRSAERQLDSQAQRRARDGERRSMADERRLRGNNELTVRDEGRARSIDASRARNNRRDTSRLENHRARSIGDPNARRDTARLETRRGLYRVDSRETVRNNLAIRRKAENARRTRTGVRVEESRLEHRREKRHAEQRRVKSAIRDNERRNVLATQRKNDIVTRRVSDVSSDLFRRLSDRLDHRRANGVKAQPQYLQNTIMSNNLNYEVLRQGIVIVLCALYGASIFSTKTLPFTNLVRYTNRLAVW